VWEGGNTCARLYFETGVAIVWFGLLHTCLQLADTSRSVMASAMLDFFDKGYFHDGCQCGQSQDGYCEIHNSNNISLTPNSVRASPNWPSIESPQDKGDISQSEAKVIKVVINQSFPRQPADDTLLDVIEYRVKLLCSESEIFAPGEHKIIKTSAEIARKAGKLSLLIKPPDNLALRFLSEGFISPSFRGSLTVSLQNAGHEELRLSAGTVVGFLIMSPFVQ